MSDHSNSLAAGARLDASSFVVIPVVDLMQGIVVRGVAGQRSRYMPVESCFCDSHQPAEILRAFRERFGLSLFYVADLEGLEDAGVQWGLLESLCQPNIDLWVDAGVTSVGAAQRLADLLFAQAGNSRIIIASESLRSLRDLTNVVAAIGPERVVFSLDLMRGTVRGKGEGVAGAEPGELMRHVAAVGVRQVIVLDVAGVGMRRGVPTLRLCRTLKSEFPEVALFSGGGVQSREDLSRIRDVGCGGALVATAFHDGILTADDVCGW